MIANVTAATAAAALLAILGSITALLIKASRWPTPTPPSKHSLAAHTDGYRPRPYDQVVLAEAYVDIPTTEPEPEPIDELDPRWDWRAYADAAERELVDA